MLVPSLPLHLSNSNHMAKILIGTKIVDEHAMIVEQYGLAKGGGNGFN